MSLLMPMDIAYLRSVMKKSEQPGERELVPGGMRRPPPKETLRQATVAHLQ